ncbi:MULTISPECIES: SUMF1/EgtB/PvdO family nonheme iron enzyme [Roseobacteraceae]|uniref:formylglycine-generating enzyme family protein n=1 Tax=Roseobacteraceae TaxID=2854170 RepID=UPI00125EB7CE|nr:MULTISPECIES: SUMF1/EgtB/PvdO family nonheme iron enzyme [Roseobacteraceae]KAB6716763.1 nitrate reductase [Roseobacter sp. TSBP12]|tara:strand:+ start:16160 stop:16921 length:762 start_codon:yes stop_codon:yes gene_type:complete
MTVSVSHVIFSSLLKIVAGMATVTLVGGAWWMLRGPDLSYVPEMAEHAVVLSDDHKIFVQKFEVTVAEWNQCHADGACDLELRAPAHEDPAFLPATGLNFVDVNQYLDWINRHSRHPFRLPTAEEWDFMAKDVLPEEPDPIFTDPALSWASSYLIEGLAPRRLVRQGSFSVSPEGIVDLDGSVWEWTEDCFAGDGGGSIDRDRCPAFFAGGEHVAAIPFLVRDPARGGCAVGSPPAHLGLRLVTNKKIKGGRV